MTVLGPAHQTFHGHPNIPNIPIFNGKMDFIVSSLGFFWAPRKLGWDDSPQIHPVNWIFYPVNWWFGGIEGTMGKHILSEMGSTLKLGAFRSYKKRFPSTPFFLYGIYNQHFDAILCHGLLWSWGIPLIYGHFFMETDESDHPDG